MKKRNKKKQTSKTTVPFYNTSDFKALNEQWKKKLADSGFDDIESDENNLKKWSVTLFLGKNMRERMIHRGPAITRYFELAAHFLNDHLFENEKDHMIWAYHCEGLSLREIEEELKKKDYRYKSYGYVNKTINRLKEIMFKIYSEDDADQVYNV